MRRVLGIEEATIESPQSAKSFSESANENRDESPTRDKSISESDNENESPARSSAPSYYIKILQHRHFAHE